MTTQWQVTVTSARIEPAGKHLAVHAAELAIEPRLRNLRRHHRRSVRGLEQAHRFAGGHQVNRYAPMGSRGSLRMTVGISGRSGHSKAIAASARGPSGSPRSPNQQARCPCHQGRVTIIDVASTRRTSTAFGTFPLDKKPGLYRLTISWHYRPGDLTVVSVSRVTSAQMIIQIEGAAA
mgnify:CR=1 FL=1